MYPHVQFTLPIFAMDMVGFGGRVSLCIADLCPIRDGPQVPTPCLASALEHNHTPFIACTLSSIRRVWRVAA
jgi:hypothetical protein